MSSRASTKKLSIRRSLLGVNIALIGLSLLLCAAGIYVALYRPLLNETAKSNMRISANEIAANIRTTFARVEGIAHSEREWGQRGLIDLDDVRAFDALVHPLLDGTSEITSAAVADENGREILILDQPQGLWINRMTNPAAWGSKAHFITRDATWRIVNDAWRPSHYDARTRPWFVAAMAVGNDDEIRWTRPFVYVSTGEPGISAVLRWTAPDGRRYAMTNDVRLAALTTLTQKTRVGRTGIVAILTSGGKILALPRDPRFVAGAAIKKAVLNNVAAIGVPSLTDAFNAWNAQHRPAGDLVSFESAQTSWLTSFQPIKLAGQTLWVATLAPTDDFASLGHNTLETGLAVVAGAIIIASLAAAWLSTRFTRPIERLRLESDRIGRMDLDSAIAVTSVIDEIDALSGSLEEMRLSLMAARQESLRKAELERQLAHAGKVEALGNLAGGIAHDFNNVLSAILGFAEILVSDLPAQSEQHRFAARIVAAVQNGRSLVRQILAFSRKEPIEEKQVELQQVVSEASAMLRATLPRTTDLVTENTVPGATVFADKGQLMQIMINLCINGSDALGGAPGRVTVLVTCPNRLRADLRRLPVADGKSVCDDIITWSETDGTGHMVTGAMPAGDCVSLVVSDSGSGILSAMLPNILEPYFSTKEPERGTGLGLAVVHRIVIALGGAMVVTTREQAGSQFEIVLPLGAGRVEERAHTDRAVRIG